MKKIVFSLVVALLFSCQHVAAQYYINTICGNGVGGTIGDGGPASAAEAGGMEQVTIDTAGNLYFADAGNNCIRKITHATGIITTVAGRNSPDSAGYSGDLGPATSAHLHDPRGVAVDRVGNIFVCDEGNNVIRKVDHATGIITTFAGGGTLVLGNGYPATAADLSSPQGIAVDKHGNLYIADLGHGLVRMVNPGDSTWIVAGISGSGFLGDGFLAVDAALNTPWSVAVDTNDNVYIADEGNHRVRKVTASTGIITTIAGNGSSGYVGTGDDIPATTTGIGYIYGLWADDAGNVYFPDAAYNTIKKVNASDGYLHIIGGANPGFPSFSGDGGPALLADLGLPQSLCLDKTGNIYVADRGNLRLRKMYQCTVPSANFSHTSGSFSVGFTYTGTTTAVDSVHWRFGDGATSTVMNPTHVYSSSGTYNACVVAYTNCDSNTHCASVTIADTTHTDTTTISGVHAVYLSQIAVYPNPVTNELNVKGIREPLNYRLLNVCGVVMDKGMLAQGSNKITTLSLAPGIYILELRASYGEQRMIRITKE